MKLGLYMATQWRQGADLGPELENLIEQVRVSKASGLASLMVGQHFVSSPLQMFQAMPLLARLAAEAEGMQLGPGLLLLPLLNPVIVAEETATLDWLCGGNAIIGLGLGYRQEEFEFDRRALQGARAALRRGRRGHPQAVARRRRRASRPLPYAERRAVEPEAQAAGRPADLDGGRFRGRRSSAPPGWPTPGFPRRWSRRKGSES